MKKVLVLLLAAGLLAACNGEDSGNKMKGEVKEEVSAGELSKSSGLMKSLVLNENHPMFLDSLDDVLKFVKKQSKKYVVLDNVGGKGYSKYRDQTVMYFRGFDSNGYVSDVQIYVEKLERKYILEDAMLVIEGYLSSELISENYKIQSTNKIVPLEDKDKNVHYIMEYRKSIENETNDSSSLPASFYVFIETTLEDVTLIRISTNKPRWMNYLEKNGYENKEWEL